MENGASNMTYKHSSTVLPSLSLCQCISWLPLRFFIALSSLQFSMLSCTLFRHYFNINFHLCKHFCMLVQLMFWKIIYRNTTPFKIGTFVLMMFASCVYACVYVCVCEIYHLLQEEKHRKFTKHVTLLFRGSAGRSEHIKQVWTGQTSGTVLWYH